VCRLRARLLPFIIAPCVLANPLAADISDVVLRLTAVNDNGTGTVEFELSDGTWDEDGHVYCLLRDQELPLQTKEGEWVATLLGANLCVSIHQTLEISLSLGLYSGSSLTTFAVDSPLLRFRTVPASESVGRAFASVSVTDLDGDFALVTGDGPIGAGACRGFYNGEFPDGALFTELVGFVYAGAYSTAMGAQQDPPFGYRDIGENVRDISVHLAFRVTPGDLAYVTMRMDVPEPREWCDGDVNVDSRVNLEDLAILLSCYGSREGDDGFCIDADFNADGIISVVDLVTVLAVYGESCP
jgi:hypothetical protein